MKKIVLVTLALIICTSIIWGCGTLVSDNDAGFEEIGYDEAVKLIEDKEYEKAYKALLKLKNNKEAKELLSKFRICYDKVITKVPGADVSVSIENVYDQNGNCIESTMYMSGERYTTTKMEYNEYNDILRKSEIALDGSVTSLVEYTYKYDENANVTEKTVKQSMESGDFEGIYHYVYDENGLLMMELSGTTKEEYFYDKNGYKIKMVRSYTETNTAYSVTEYVNDENGRSIKETRYSGSNSIEAVIERKYDGKGNILKEKRSYGSDDLAAMTVEYEYIGEHIFYVEKSN